MRIRITPIPKEAVDLDAIAAALVEHVRERRREAERLPEAQTEAEVQQAEDES